MTVTERVDESISFGLEYDGTALTQHEMDVRDLAPALLSAGNLFQELNRITNPDSPSVAVNVRATSDGSFQVDLRLLFQIAEQAEQGLLTRPVIAASVLVTLLGGVGSLINLTRKRHAAGQEIAQEQSDTGSVKLTFSDNTTLEVPQTVLNASRELIIQRDLAEMVKPLNREGIDSMTLKREQIVIARVEKSEVAGFTPRPSPTRATLATNEREVFLTIRSAGFATGRWGFSDGSSNFTAKVSDETFMARVHAGEKFSELDVLRCRIREIQTRDERGLHGSVEVLEVIDHLPPAQGQLELPDN